MSERAGTARMVLELEPGAEPIIGTVSIGGERWPFVGWMGLIGVIERAQALVTSRAARSTGGEHARAG